MPDMVAQLHPMWCKLVPPRQSPLRPETWRSLLRFHPDKDFVDVVMAGLEFGWELHYNGQRHTPTDCTNSRLHAKYARELREIRAKEFALHFRAGPFPSLAEGPKLPLANLRTAKTGPAFKRLSDKIRHVVDSSFPYDDSSVNAAINRKPWSRLFNARFPSLAQQIVALGRFTLLFKFDVVGAYKLLLLLLQEWHLLGEKDCVNDQTVHSFSTTVSFGARSSADLFDYLASAAEFILRLCVTQADALARYADDQIACVRPLPAGPDWQKFQRMKQQVCNTCIALGIPIDKFAEGTSVEYLGTGADSAAMIAFIPEARRLWAIEHLSSWLKRKFASKKALQSLAGNLQWLSNVVLWGRPHIRAIIAASSRWGKIAIPALIRSSVRWWIQVLQHSPTVPLLYFCPFAPDVVIDSDASSTGFGAWSPTLRVYLFGTFSKAEIKDSTRSLQRSMGHLELLAVLIAISTWRHKLRGSSVHVRVDNTEALFAINKRSSRVSAQASIIAAMGMIATSYSIRIEASFTPTPAPHLSADECNKRADALSRNQESIFLELTQSWDLSRTTPKRATIRA